MGRVGRSIGRAFHSVGHAASSAGKAIGSTVKSVANGVGHVAFKGIGAAKSLFENLAPGLKNLDKILKKGLLGPGLPLSPFSFMKGMKNLTRHFGGILKHLQNPMFLPGGPLNMLMKNMQKSGLPMFPPELARMQKTLGGLHSNFAQLQNEMFLNLRG